MVRFSLPGAPLAAYFALLTAALGGDATAARALAEAVPAAAPPLPDQAADLQLHFVQEGGPESGHVRVVLTPEARPLTALEARSVAEEGFLDALDEPGLGDYLTRITVVVRLMPATLPDAETREAVFLFVRKGGSEWSVTAGD